MLLRATTHTGLPFSVPVHDAEFVSAPGPHPTSTCGDNDRKVGTVNPQSWSELFPVGSVASMMPIAE